jgi:nitrate reductase gamma subunit
MGGAVLLFFYGSILFCLIASAVRARKYLSAPLHLRGELYRGSSVYELTNWSQRSGRHLGEKVRGMILDVLLLREFYHRNRGFWYSVFLFHAGIYLLLLWHLWLFVTALVLPFDSAWRGGLLFGHLATVLSLIGGVGVLVQRLVDRELSAYYPRLHYLKWLLIILILLGGFLAVVLHFDSDISNLLTYVRVQVTFQDRELKLHPALAPASHVFLVSFLLLYLPFSHILQIFFRYYQHLRWDDVPSARGSSAERRVGEQLTRPIGWSAPHVDSGRSWGQVTGEPEDS